MLGSIRRDPQPSPTVQLAMSLPTARNLHVKTEEIEGFRWVRLKKIEWKDETDRKRMWEAAERTTRTEGTVIDAVAAITYVTEDGETDNTTWTKRKREEMETNEGNGENVSTKLELELPSPKESADFDLNQEYQEGEQPTPEVLEPEVPEKIPLSRGKNASRMVLVSQFRPAVGKYVLEIPAGLVDERDIHGGAPAVAQTETGDQDVPSREHSAEKLVNEEKLELASKRAAERELYEETGLHGTAYAVSPVVYSDPGLSNASVRFVRIDVNTWGKQQHHSSELESARIKTHFVSVGQPLQDALRIAKGGQMELDARLYAFLAGIEEGLRIQGSTPLGD